jgi:hypothetical protein
LTGAQGDTGIAGAQGAVGSQGSQGNTGTQGAVGSQGLQGNVGAQGPQGNIGATGPQGVVGTQGPLGPSFVPFFGSTAGRNISSTTATRYAGIGDDDATETVVQLPLPVSGTLRNLRVRASVAPGAAGGSVQQWTFTVRINGANTALSCVVAETATACSDLANSLLITEGQLISMQIVPSGNPTTNKLNWSMRIDQ